MRLRTLLRGLVKPPKEAAASTLVRGHFHDLWTAHTLLLVSGEVDPIVVVADHARNFGRAVCAANGIADPDRPCVFGSTASKFLRSLSESPAETVTALRRAIAAQPPASETCMRVAVFTGGDVVVLHYLHTKEPAAAAA